MRPLDGIIVVSLEQAVAAPFATRQLADLGARVIKVERPNVGDFARHYDKSVLGQSAYFVWLNRSKESLTLDIKHAEAKRILSRLISGADVFVQNLAPGAAARAGFGPEELRSKHPRLIVCNISGYGNHGPYAGKKAYDLLIQSEAGVLSVTGTEEVPSKVGMSITDIGTGLHAYAAILAALFQRVKTDTGTSIEVAMFDAMVEWMNHPLYYTKFSGKGLRRSGPDHATIVPYGKFEAGDGNGVIFGVQNEREWRTFCEHVIRKPELASDDRYDNNTKRTVARDEIVSLINAAFASLTSAEVISRLDKAGIANGRLNTPLEVWDHVQLKARGRWRNVESPLGLIPALLPPPTHQDFESRMDPIPALGQHTDQILKDLGYNIQDIEALRAANVI